MKLGGFQQIHTINPDETELVQSVPLGTIATDTNGDLFRYFQAGTGGVAKGKLALAPAPKTNHHNIAVAAAAAIGAVQVTVTLGATAAVANEYQEGYMVISDATGEGEYYRIKNHPAADSAGSLTLTLDTPLKVALTTSSEVTLVHNKHKQSVIGQSTTRMPVGVPNVTVAADAFGWAKVRGVAPTLAQGAIDLGNAVVGSGSVDGAVAAASDTAATNFDQVKVGYAMVAGVDTEYRPIYLDIH